MPSINTNFIPPKVKNDLTARFANLIKGKKVYVAIDAANLYYAALKAKMYIDFEQIYSWFSKKAKYAEIGFYTAYNIDDEKQQEFLGQLESYGYTLIQKPIKVFNDKIKGNMDIEIAVDIIQKQTDFDTFVLMSGDGDFRYLINAIQKKTIVLSVGGFTSFDLHQDADNYFFLNRVSSIWKSRKSAQEKPKIDESYLIFVDQMDYPEPLAFNEQLNSQFMPSKPPADKEIQVETKPKKTSKKPKVRLRLKKQRRDESAKPIIIGD